jgi:hypothetical protein
VQPPYKVPPGLKVVGKKRVPLKRVLRGYDKKRFLLRLRGRVRGCSLADFAEAHPIQVEYRRLSPDEAPAKDLIHSFQVSVRRP